KRRPLSVSCRTNWRVRGFRCRAPMDSRRFPSFRRGSHWFQDDVLGSARRGPLNTKHPGSEDDLSARHRNSTQSLGNVSADAHRLGLVIFADQIKDLACFGSPAKPQCAVFSSYDECRHAIAFVLDLSHDLLEYVFESDDALGASIFVD